MSTTHHDLREPTSRKHRPRAVLALLALAQLVVAVDFDIVFVALPEIGRELAFSPQSLQWVVSAYTVALGGFLLAGGRAADRLGARRVFLVGAVLFGISSLFGGLAAGPEMLVASRAVQGLGAALLIPSTLKLINTNFAEGPARTNALAVWGIAGSSGAALGALGGGVLTGFLGWEWVLFVNVPFTILATIAGFTLLPADRKHVGTDFRDFDLPGAALATAGSTSVVFELVNGPETGWATFRAAGCLILGAGLLVAFFALERRSRNALVPLHMFRNRNLAVAVAVVFAFMSAIATQYYVFTTYLQEVLGYGALTTGLGFLPMSVLSMIGSGVLFPPPVEALGIADRAVHRNGGIRRGHGDLRGVPDPRRLVLGGLPRRDRLGAVRGHRIPADLPGRIHRHERRAARGRRRADLDVAVHRRCCRPGRPGRDRQHHRRRPRLAGRGLDRRGGDGRDRVPHPRHPAWSALTCSRLAAYLLGSQPAACFAGSDGRSLQGPGRPEPASTAGQPQH
ncbi:MFS transporter, partial [Saccharopolyspora sp. NPDC002686]|uniref:MFS transporter n=1 Tax=Saccharopolyspora sp. NPDC002686 TaxID=3154541 RepID=UPI00332FC065